MKQQKSVLLDYLELIVKWRRFIVRSVAMITMIAAIISLLLTQKFTATATMLPPSSDQTMLMGLMAGGLPGGLTNIPGISSILPTFSTPSDLYAAILKSGRIKSKIIKRYDLQKVFKTKTMSDTYESLNEITSITVSPEGIVSVSVTYIDKYMAADIANAYLEELDRFNTQTAMTTGKKYRLFIEERLKETEDSLKQAENLLRTFQEENRTVALDVEIENAIMAIAQLKSQILLLEVKKGTYASSSQINNPHLSSINRELRELRKQLEKIEFGDTTTNNKEFGAGFSVPFTQLPKVTLEYMRLFRDVKVQEVIYEILTQQYEQAKIMELKDTPTVQILDKASPPEKRSFPKRTVIIMLVFFSSIAVSILTIFMLEYVNEELTKPQSPVARVLKLYGQIKRDIMMIFQKFKK